MKKLILVLIAILIIVSMVTPVFAETTRKNYSPSPWVNPGDDDDDDDDDDHHHSSDTEGETTSDTVANPNLLTVATVSDADVENVKSILGVDDLGGVFKVTVPASLKGTNNTLTFKSDLLKTADGKEPSPLPFKLFKIVGDQATELVYGVDYFVNWEIGEITVLNITEDCFLALVPAE